MPSRYYINTRKWLDFWSLKKKCKSLQSSVSDNALVSMCAFILDVFILWVLNIKKFLPQKNPTDVELIMYKNISK